MTALIGTYSLCLAVLAAIGTLLVSLAAVRFGSQELYRTARRGIVALALLLSIASAALLVALAQSDLRLEYVARYSERALPMGYKLAAFWAGQAGSLLLWAWIMAILAVIYVWQNRRSDQPDHAIAVATLAAVIGFFAVLMIGANTPESKADPFAPVEIVPADGQGLNPMLQDPGMLAHPPLLFVGYAGFAVPFALLMGALVTSRLDQRWILAARPWALVSWIFLGAGIVLGAWWAYKELGWGGYWAWDPVENASLLPWLTGTALLHSIIGQRQRGILRRWTAVLTALTFILCILGTYITRSGVVSSVHTFGQSLVGTFFLLMLIVMVLASLVLLAMRWIDLRPARAIESWSGRDTALAAANWLLTGMMLITLVLTFLPAISSSFSDLSLTAAQRPYNVLVLPLGLLLAALMALAPVLTYGRTAASRLLRSMGLPLGLGLAATITIAILGHRSAWALASAAVCGTLVGSVLIDVLRQVGMRRANLGETIPVAALRLVRANHRRFGAHIVHTGIILIVAGVAGSSLYTQKEMIQLTPGETADFGRYQLTLNSIDEVRGVNFTAVSAELTVTSPRGRQYIINPQHRYYDKFEQPSSEVAIRSNWREDLYVTLAAWEDGGRLVTFQAIVSPLVVWIWAGGIVLAAGGLVCLVPAPAARRAVTTEPVAEKRRH